MPVVNEREFRLNFASHMDAVVESREPLVVTRHGGKRNVVVIAESEFEGWQATVHLLSNARNAERLRSSIAQAEAGELVERDLIDCTRA